TDRIAEVVDEKVSSRPVNHPDVRKWHITARIRYRLSGAHRPHGPSSHGCTHSRGCAALTWGAACWVHRRSIVGDHRESHGACRSIERRGGGPRSLDGPTVLCDALFKMIDATSCGWAVVEVRCWSGLHGRVAQAPGDGAAAGADPSNRWPSVG